MKTETIQLTIDHKDILYLVMLMKSSTNNYSSYVVNRIYLYISTTNLGLNTLMCSAKAKNYKLANTKLLKHLSFR